MPQAMQVARAPTGTVQDFLNEMGALRRTGQDFLKEMSTLSKQPPTIELSVVLSGLPGSRMIGQKSGEQRRAERSPPTPPQLPLLAALSSSLPLIWLAQRGFFEASWGRLKGAWKLLRASWKRLVAAGSIM